MNQGFPSDVDGGEPGRRGSALDGRGSTQPSLAAGPQQQARRGVRRIPRQAARARAPAAQRAIPLAPRQICGTTFVARGSVRAAAAIPQTSRPVDAPFGSTVHRAFDALLMPPPASAVGPAGEIPSTLGLYEGRKTLRVGRFIGRLGVVSLPAVEAGLDLDQRVVRRHVAKLEAAGWRVGRPGCGARDPWCG
jgi:hypothetical protein